MHLTISKIADRNPTARLEFDRATGVITGASAKEKLLVRAFQAGARLSSIWSYRGFGAGCKILREFSADRAVEVRLNDSAVFSFPFGDSYWSLLFDTSYHYEHDLELFFRGVSDVDYTLVDCGANFGYWSTLVSSRPFGGHASIAIEPSSSNFAVLANNATINGGRFHLIHSAVGATAGMAHLSGRKHEAMTIAGSPGEAGEDVPVITLDSLSDRLTDSAQRRCVIKLDVEGVEIDALKGGSRLLQSDCVVICEEHGNDRHHTLSRYILDKTPLKLFCFDPATRRFERLRDVSPLDRIKSATNFGYNVLGTASPFWEARIQSLGMGSPASS